MDEVQALCQSTGILSHASIYNIVQITVCSDNIDCQVHVEMHSSPQQNALQCVCKRLLPCPVQLETLGREAEGCEFRTPLSLVGDVDVL